MKKKTPDEQFKEIMDIRKMIKEEVEQVGGHFADKPSTDTVKMINELKVCTTELKTNQTNFMKELQEFKENYKQAHKELRDEIKNDSKIYHNEIKEMIKTFQEEIKSHLKQKANKWVETLIKSALITIGLGGLALTGALMIQGIIHFYRP
jgi:C-terminal processing protease CtpA/Prc